ncbi:MAG: rRNA maturation RNase YbeY [Desulfovibrio sp.]|nr:rRNA maturation RNase YbeY [Desulfovibrio sp.]
MAWLCPVDKRVLQDILTGMLAQVSACAVPETPAAVELFLLDDAHLSKANRQYMHCCGPTNVLSFPGGHGAVGTLLLSLDALRRECLFYGQDAGEHMVRLLAHGLAHLCGLEHGAAMNALCDRLQRHGFVVLASAW